MRATLDRFRRLPRAVYQLLAAQLLANLVGVGIMLVFNLHLRALGWGDPEIAHVTSFRFLGALVLGVPLGLWMRGRKLRPFFVFAAVMVPASTWVMIHLADAGKREWIWVTMLGWGMGMMCFQIGAVPFILRLTGDDNRTEGLALSMATFPVSLLACGVLVPVLQHWERLSLGGWTLELDDAGVLRLLILISTLGVPLVLWLREAEPPGAAQRRDAGALGGWREHDWGKIFLGAGPNLMIAMGAGLTIPYVNLFFNAVFALEANQFSALGGVAGVLVLAAALLNTQLRRALGYRVAIVGMQSLSVVFLVLLAFTEIYKDVPGMLWLAMGCYLIRQPLMNSAQPITTELTMSFVGERNRELMSALSQSLWSGSWFLSAKVFQHLRALELPYWQIFLVTSALYAVGIVLYARLIGMEERQREEGAAVVPADHAAP